MEIRLWEVLDKKYTMKKILFVLCFLTFLVGCGESADLRYDTGFDDSYAVGYNTTCKIRATLVEGDWDDENYSKGYNDGLIAGADECRANTEEES